MPTLAVAIDARQAKIGAGVADQSFRKVKGGAKRARDEFGRFTKQTNATGTALRKLSGPLTAIFGSLAGIAAIRQSISVLRDFEQSMRTVQGVTRSTAEEFENLEIQARKMGATTRFSAQQAAEGLLFLGRAGFNTNQAIESLPATLNLATAGAVDLGFAADTASNVLKGFGLEVSQTERVVDVFINTTNSANTDVRQLAEAMKFVAPIARKAGQSIEETSAQIGVLGDAGIQASMAGTNLRGIFLALAGPTTAAQKAFASLGLTMDDVDIKSLGLTQVLENLNNANIGLAEATDIFGRRNAAAALIIGESAGRVRELTEANKNAAGEADRVAKIMDDSLNGAFLTLKSSVEEAILTLGDSGFGAALKTGVEAITDMVRFLIGMQNNLNGSIQRAAALAAVFKLVVGVLTAVVAIKAVLFFKNLAIGLGAAAKASLALNAGLSPVLVTLAALGSLVLGLEIGRWLSDEFKIVRVAGKETAIFLLKAWENFKLGFQGIIVVVSSVWENFVNDAKVVWRELLYLLADGFAELEKVLPEDISKKLGIGPAATELAAAAEAIEVDNRKLKDRIADKLDNLAEEARKTQERIKILEQVSKDMDDAIEKEFGGRQSKGTSFIDFVAKDLEAAKAKLVELNNELNLTSKASLDVKVNMDDINDVLPNIENGFERSNKKSQEMSETMKDIKSAALEIGDAFASSIERAVFEGQTLKQTINELGRDIAKIVFRQTVTSAISGGIGGLFPGAGGGIPANGSTVTNALGNAYSGGNPMRFQAGGIIQTPMRFGLAGNRTGLAGEAGPEGILPLRRGRGGRLGVEVTGSGGATTNNIVMNVTTRDAGSFKQSKSQILSDLRSGIGRSG